MSLGSIVVEPSTAPCAGAVIWLHGLGADGHDFEPVVPLLQLPAVRFVFPNAPARPVTINRGFVMPSWYDIMTLDPNPSPDTPRENVDDVYASARSIVDVIEEQAEHGIEPQRIVLAGFSQGGAIALHVANRFPQALAGIMVLSSYHVAATRLEAERHPANDRTPMLFAHGERDPMVPIERGRQAYADMRDAFPDRRIQWAPFPMEHEVSREEIEVIRVWLHERLG